MKILRLTYCLLILIVWASLCYAQTPYDSFAPETSRQILDERAIAAEQEAERVKRESQMDTIVCAAVIDMENQVLLLVDVCDCVLLSHEYSDEDWEEWICDSLDNNVEISEMRNEYLFCQLSLQSYDRFLNYLYNLINTHPHLKIIIANELKNPVNDVIDLNLCIDHISKSRTKKSFKNWMIKNIKHNS